MDAAIDRLSDQCVWRQSTAKAAEPDRKVFHAKIGQLTLEHDC